MSSNLPNGISSGTAEPNGTHSSGSDVNGMASTAGDCPANVEDGATLDVVIVGGGPVGLLLAYQLNRFGVSAYVLEQHEKETQDAYGRAIAMFPRTLEQLDQLGLIDSMLQLGFSCRSSVTYKDGERVMPGRVWTFMENIKDTDYDFTLVLRQMYTEAIIREKLDSADAAHFRAVQCTGFEIDEHAPPNSHAVTSTFVDKRAGRTFKLRSRYIVGADGGRSFVRRQSGIPFEGDTSEDRWIRIDGVVETDMPITRAYGAIESRTHGNVLWAPMDHGTTRIGYAYSDAIAAKYPAGVTQEVAEKEAIESMKPFKLRFKQVHWWTLYTIGQRVAKTFASQDRIFLCGDAAHTHSSGAAQGLNTGIHDAVNLGWKLALRVRGLACPEVLGTYSAERKTAVERLINYDKDIATLMSHKWPSWYTGDKTADPYMLLGEIFEQASSFNTGLGISYPENVINRAGSAELTLVSGSRPPDVHLQVPGTNQDVRLQQVTRNVGKFWVVVCTGNVASTRHPLGLLRDSVDSVRSTPLAAHAAVGWVTLCPTKAGSPFEALDALKPFGCLYFDSDQAAHGKMGVDGAKGAVIVLRPDGLVGCTGPLQWGWIEEYLGSILR